MKAPARAVFDRGRLSGRHWRPAAELVRRHRLFTTLLAGAFAVRLAAILAFRPALYFYDSYEYVGVALRPQPYVVRPSGYSFLLMLLEPFHSLRLVVLLQHLMGLAVAVVFYALLRRYAVPAVIAAAATGPQLFDGEQIELEHLVLSETLFTFLTVVAVALLLWWRSAATWTFAASGALFAAASVTRVVGLPLALVALGWLLMQRSGSRHAAVFAAALVIPLVGYAGWYQSYHGSFSLTGSGGVFLYSRTMSFADCSRMNPPAELLVLCTTEPPDDRQTPSNYIWHSDSPLQDIQGPTFSAYKEKVAGKFAVRAILSQPADYAWAVSKDFARTFGPRMNDYPTWDLARHYRFSDQPVQIPDRTFVAGGTAPHDLRAYERGDAAPRAARPLAGWLARYQQLVIVPGPVLGLLLFAPTGLLVRAAAVRRRAGPHRDRAVPAGDGPGPRESAPGPPAAGLALVVAAGFILLAVPPMTAGFDHRYVPPALAFLGTSAALAVHLRCPRRGRSTLSPARRRTTAPERSG